VTDSQPTDQPPGSAEDLYAKCLHLPPGQRPPNLYELLGLELFCSHPERIHHAARKQFRRIKPYEDHPDRDTRDAIQDIMTRIATARIVLSDPSQKEEYDQALAKEMGIDRRLYLAGRVAAPLPDCCLRIVAGPEMTGQRVDLIEGQTVTVGHDPHCVITLPSSRIGKLHCHLEYTDGEWLLRQIDQHHLTLVNDNRVYRSPLADGDAIDAGGYRLRFMRLSAVDRDGPRPPPISLIVRKGPSIPAPVFNALPTESILIGHCETALWQLPGPLVSRHHCRIRPARKLWEIEDLRSTNGTLVNGQPVEYATPINNRDELTIGQFEVLVSLRH
jgi:pSer/pThr/pTyr-binding forkhead associated (FHA) protein